MWQKLSAQSSADDVRKDWVALCAAWETFHASMERHLGAMPVAAPVFKPVSIAEPMAGARPLPPLFPTGAPVPPFPTGPAVPPLPPPLPAKPSDAELAERERHVLEKIQSISNEMTGKINQIQMGYMSGSLGPNQTNPMMAEQYNFGLGALQMLRVEASALADAGKGDAMKTLDAFVEDTKKAITVVGGMVQQQRTFEMGISKIWQDTNTSLVTSQLEMNRKTSQAYEEQNKKYFDKY